MELLGNQKCQGTVVLRGKVTPLCTRSAQGLSLVSTTSPLAGSLE